MKYCSLFVLLISLLSVMPVLPQDADEINNKAAAILLTLAQDKIFPEKQFEDLKSQFFINVNEDLLKTKYHSDISSFDSLRTHLVEYETVNIGISPDSSLVLFTSWYIHLRRIFYDYYKQNFFNSPKTKILYFSTSVSCYCTLEMCRKQMIEILKLQKMNGDAYSFLIVDSYWNIDLQLKYEAYFAPSVLVFNSGNELVSLIEYDERMPEKLNVTLKKL